MPSTNRRHTGFDLPAPASVVDWPDTGGRPGGTADGALPPSPSVAGGRDPIGWGPAFPAGVAAIDPYLCTPRDAFQASVHGLVSAVKSARREPGVEEVLLPGERALRARRQALEEGLEIDPDVHRLLTASDA